MASIKKIIRKTRIALVKNSDFLMDIDALASIRIARIKDAIYQFRQARREAAYQDGAF